MGGITRGKASTQSKQTLALDYGGGTENRHTFFPHTCRPCSDEVREISCELLRLFASVPAVTHRLSVFVDVLQGLFCLMATIPQRQCV